MKTTIHNISNPPVPEIKDWRKFHRDNVAKLDQIKVHAAVSHLKCIIAKWDNLEQIKAEAKINPEWWVGYHFFGMMAIRNDLRMNGFGEKEFGIYNLDDYTIGLLEIAMEIE